MQWIRRQWFLVGLIACLTIGFTCWHALQSVTTWTVLRDSIVAGTLFCMSLPLRTEIVWRTLRHPTAAAFAILFNFAVLPLVAWGTAWTLSPPLAIGLLVTAATPCTLASAAVWTRRAGGNDAVALIVTVLTNGSCFVITPLWLWYLTGSEIELSFVAMAQKLGWLVVFPMFLGQLAQHAPAIGNWAVARKAWLAWTAQIGILSMVLIGAIKCGEELSRANGWSGLDPWDVAKMLGACAVVHLVTLGLGMFTGRAVGLARPDWIAVGISGSQKTLMIGLQIAVDYYGGLTILPMVAYHGIQLLLDTLIADRLSQAAITQPNDGPNAQ